MQDSLSAHRLTLSRELVDDVELSRLPAEQLLLKASRLARLVEDTKTSRWLQWELQGYPSTPHAISWMRYFGRFTNEEKNLGYWIPLAGVSGTIAIMQAQIQSLQVPSLNFSPSSSNPHENVTGFAGANVNAAAAPAKDVLTRLQALTTAVSQLTSIRSRVLAAIHEFAVKEYHELAFSGLAQTVFELHEVRVDGLLASNAPEVQEKLPAIYERLGAGDPEAISQAMNSLRRLIKAFADALYPPSEGSRDVDGQKYEIGSDKVLNRIKLYLIDNSPSKSRIDRLSRSIRDIYERASVGSHSDITAGEARSLFLATYMTLGEVLDIAPPAPGSDVG